jgi:hypothetical protein
MCWAVRHCWISQRKVNVRLQKRTGFSQSHISFEPLPDMLTLCVLIFFQCLKSRHAPQLAYSFYSQASVLILLTGISTHSTHKHQYSLSSQASELIFLTGTSTHSTHRHQNSFSSQAPVLILLTSISTHSTHRHQYSFYSQASVLILLTGISTHFTHRHQYSFYSQASVAANSTHSLKFIMCASNMSTYQLLFRSSFQVSVAANAADYTESSVPQTCSRTSFLFHSSFQVSVAANADYTEFPRSWMFHYR